MTVSSLTVRSQRGPFKGDPSEMQIRSRPLSLCSYPSIVPTTIRVKFQVSDLAGSGPTWPWKYITTLQSSLYMASPLFLELLCSWLPSAPHVPFAPQDSHVLSGMLLLLSSPPIILLFSASMSQSGLP